MTKIYIIGVGEHYEFSIGEVFSNEEDAERYAELLNNTIEGSEACVITREIKTSLQIETFNLLKIKTSKVLERGDYEFNMEIVEAGVFEEHEEELREMGREDITNFTNVNTTTYFRSDDRSYLYNHKRFPMMVIQIVRKLPSIYNRQEIENRFKEETQKIFAKIEENPSLYTTVEESKKLGEYLKNIN